MTPLIMPRDYRTKRLTNATRVNFLLKAYSFMGIGTAIASSFYLVTLVIDISLSKEQTLAIAGVAFGCLLAVGSAMLREFYSARTVEARDTLDGRDAMFAFIQEWALFEELARRALDTPQDRRVSTRTLLAGLFEKALITGEDRLFLIESLNARNALIHQQPRHADDMMQLLYSRLSDVNRKLLDATLADKDNDATPPP